MGKELVPIGRVYDVERNDDEEMDDALDAMPIDVLFDEYIDVLPAESREVSTPLDQADEEALELGIASVFDALRAESEEPTLALLAELNRLWARPLAA